MIDLAKKYRTRDGREAKVFMVDAGTSHPVIAAYRDSDAGIWWSLHFTAEGRVSQSRTDPRDLIEVRPRIQREVWVNVYPEPLQAMSWLFLTRELADSAAASTKAERIACVKLVIDCEEGEGL